MRYQIPLVVVMVAAVASMATFGVTSSVTNLSSQDTNTERIGLFMLGHVEMILRNSDGDIKNYIQGDNLITNVGDRCVAEKLWISARAGNAGAENCKDGADFDVIGITNGTTYTPNIADRIGLYNGAGDGLGTNGEIMATIPDTVVSIETINDGVDTTIDNSGHLFNFDINNFTVVRSVLLLDGACAELANGACDTVPGADAGDILAVRIATLSVSAGDTLQVTWTITSG